LGVFFVVPTAFLVSQSLQTGTVEEGYSATWNYENYLYALAHFSTQFTRSLLYATLTTIFTFIIGYPLAYAIAIKASRLKYLLLVLVIAPFLSNFLLRTLAWQTILSSDGLVTELFRSTHLITVTSWLGLTNGDQLLNSPLAVIAGLTYNFLPFMTLPLFASLDKLDPKLLEAAADLYAEPSVTFRRVTLPLSAPGIAAGAVLTFIPAAGDFINSQLLGNPNTVMLGQVIDSQFLRVLDYPIAAALSVALMVTVAVLVVAYLRVPGVQAETDV
jgi:spermidine/putrescine transport system permease protein